MGMIPSMENKQGRCPVNPTSTSPRQVPSALGYAIGAIAASVVYVLWDAFVFLRSEPSAAQIGLGSRLMFVSGLWLVGGFAAALLAMIVPWSLAVWAYRKLRRYGQFYFPAVGAFLVFILSCASSSLAPKPLFVEYQTFLRGAAIAAEREGIAFLLAGLAFGGCYWFFSERNIPVRE